MFALEEKDIGNYIVKLTQANPDSGCKVDIDDTQTVTVEWILSLSQIKGWCLHGGLFEISLSLSLTHTHRELNRGIIRVR